MLQNTGDWCVEQLAIGAFVDTKPLLLDRVGRKPVR